MGKKIDTELGVPSETIVSSIPHNELLGPEELEAMGYEIEGDASKPLRENPDMKKEQEESRDEENNDDAVVEKPKDSPVEDAEAEKPEIEEGSADTEKDIQSVDTPESEEEVTEEPSVAEKEYVPDVVLTLMDIIPQSEINELAEKRDKALNDYQSGEIDQEEYLDARNEYSAAVRENARSEAFNAKAIANQWKSDCNVFYSRNPEAKENDTLWNAINGLITEYNKTPEGQALSNIELLNWGRDKAMKDLGLIKAKIESSKTDKKEKEKADALKKAKAGNADRSAGRVGDDLRDTPIAQPNKTDEGGEFAYLDKLRGDDFQKAVDRLTPQQRERFEDDH